MTTSPASYVDSVVTTLQSELAQHGVLPTAIRSIDWDLAGEPTRITIGDPFVALLVKGFQFVDDETGAPKADVQMVAICGARAHRSKDAELMADLNTRGDVAGFIATQVARLCRSPQDWGSDLVKEYAGQVVAVNEAAHKLRDQGLSVWTVGWSQAIEITHPNAILGPIASVHQTHTVVGSTPDTEPYETHQTF